MMMRTQLATSPMSPWIRISGFYYFGTVCFILFPFGLDERDVLGKFALYFLFKLLYFKIDINGNYALLLLSALLLLLYLKLCYDS